MRLSSSITSVSWIPSEAIPGLTRLPFDLGVTHYDDPPPGRIGDLDEMRRTGAFRFANHLAAWIEVEDHKIVGHGYSGRGYISSTRVRLGRAGLEFQPIALPDLQRTPEVHEDRVRFAQTTGGRTGVPAPRRARGRPFVRIAAPVVWTTLSLTLFSDGRLQWELSGASGFPRHWVYDHEGSLVAKSGLTTFEEWYHSGHEARSPWGNVDSPAFVTMAETALERELSTTIMRSGKKPRVGTLRPGDVLVREGEQGKDIFLLLDGMLRVDVAGQTVAELGPGAVVGERAVLEGGRRTSTLTALTPCRVALASAGDLEEEVLRELSASHRREDEAPC
jgi:hypothetical protein